MSVGYIVVVDTSQADALMAQIQETTADISQGILDAVEQTFLPAVIALSQSIWGVRTGQYSESWEPEVAGASLVLVTNTAEAISDGYPYSLSLEYGWRYHAGGFVAEQAVDATAGDIGEVLLDWVMGTLPAA